MQQDGLADERKAIFAQMSRKRGCLKRGKWKDRRDGGDCMTHVQRVTEESKVTCYKELQYSKENKRK